jgi:hypothetical protein
MDVPPDIVNRSLFIWMTRLTDEQRDRGGVLSAITSGRMSMRMRFAALAVCELHDIAQRAEAMPRTTSTHGWRFPVLRAIARILWADRYGDAGVEGLDDALENMRHRHAEHTVQSDNSGVLAMLESSSIFKLRLITLFEDLTINDVHNIQGLCEVAMTAQNHAHGYSMNMLLRARADTTGYATKPIWAMVESLLGGRGRPSDRRIAMALGEDVRVTLAVGETMALPEHLGLAGWKITRFPDNNGSPRVRLLPPVTVRKPKL